MEPITKQQKVLVGVLLLAGMYVFNSRFLRPQGMQLKNLEQEVSQKESKLQLVKQRASKLDQLKLDFEFLKKELSAAEQKLPKRKEISALLRKITRSGQKFKINFLSISPQAEISQTYFIKIPISVSVSTYYHSLGLFLAELGQLERIVKVNNLNIMAKSPTEGDPTNISANFQLTTYIFKSN
ncbi:type 4a pilus biogenesis protein PilO [bacterium]|nr:type 4a pilus biogenesis protein PilO [bacterium]